MNRYCYEIGRGTCMTLKMMNTKQKYLLITESWIPWYQLVALLEAQRKRRAHHHTQKM